MNVATTGVADNTAVTAELVNSADGSSLSPAVTTSGAITSNAASLTLNVPATVAAGSYNIKVTVGALTDTSTAYTVNPAQSITSETLTVSNPSTTGFTITLNPPLNGLTTSNFVLKDSSNNPVSITSAQTSDSGANYTIAATLLAGQTYSVTATDSGYDFGTVQNVIVPAATYTVTYNGNGSTGGSVPVDNNNYAQGASVTVLDNTGNLVNTGYTFAGWNTAADGNGTSYAAGATFTMGNADVTLYAQWTANPTYTVTFTVTDGTNPIQGATVTLGSNYATTDTNGQASFNLDNGTYSYTVSAAGMQNDSGNVTVNGANVTQTVTLSPAP